jgi:hypothetical protein
LSAEDLVRLAVFARDISNDGTPGSSKKNPIQYGVPEVIDICCAPEKAYCVRVSVVQFTVT